MTISPVAALMLGVLAGCATMTDRERAEAGCQMRGVQPSDPAYEECVTNKIYWLIRDRQWMPHIDM